MSRCTAGVYALVPPKTRQTQIDDLAQPAAIARFSWHAAPDARRSVRPANPRDSCRHRLFGGAYDFHTAGKTSMEVLSFARP